MSESRPCVYYFSFMIFFYGLSILTSNRFILTLYNHSQSKGSDHHPCATITSVHLLHVTGKAKWTGK